MFKQNTPKDIELRVKSLENQLQSVIIALSAIQERNRSTTASYIPVIGTISNEGTPDKFRADFMNFPDIIE